MFACATQKKQFFFIIFNSIYKLDIDTDEKKELIELKKSNFSDKSDGKIIQSKLTPSKPTLNGSYYTKIDVSE